MDTSETYIKMCDCPEIQEHSLCDGGGHFYAWRSPHFKKQVHVDSYPGGKGTSVWLPRQDQIQEMIEKHNSNLDLLVHFYGFATLDESLSFDDRFNMSMEQLWLAFYIHEKHGKTWNGKEWEKKA